MAKEYFDDISTAQSRVDTNFVCVLDTQQIEKSKIHHGKTYTKAGKTFQQHSRLWQIAKSIQLLFSLNPFVFLSIKYFQQSYKKYIKKIAQEFLTGQEKISLYILQENSIEHQVFHLSQNLPPNVQTHFLNVIKNIEPEYRKSDMIRTVHLHFQLISNHTRKNYIIPLIQEIPAHEVKLHHIELLLSVYHGITDKPAQMLFDEILSVPPNEREKFALQLSLLFDGITSDHQQFKMLEAIHKIPIADKTKVLSTLNPFLIKIFNAQIRSYTLQVILKVYRRSERNIIPQILSIFKNVHETTLIDWIADSIYAIPKEHRELVILKAAASLAYIPNTYKRTAILAIIALIPPEFLTQDVLLEIPYLFQSISNRDHKNIIEKIKKFPAHQRADIIHLLKPIIENVDEYDFRNTIIHTILHIPESERTLALETATPFLLETPSGRSRIRILKYIWMIAPIKRSQALQFAKLNNALDSGRFIYTVFADSEIRDASHEYLYNRLEDSLLDRPKAEALAESIINFAEKLLLNEDHILFNRAIEVLTITDQATLDSFRNAYTLFSHLKNCIANESPVNHSLPQYPFGDSFISLNLTSLQQNGEMKNTFEKIPEDITPDTFIELFDKMEKRLEALTLREQLAICEYILDSYSLNFSEIKMNLLNKPLIPSLLRIKGNPNQPFEMTSYYLHIIAKRIVEASDECLPPSFLTEQEEMLLAFSSSVQNCSIGQKDGISIFYHRINRLDSRGESNAELLAKIVDNTLQTIFSDILCSREFLKILGVENFSQEAHQTLYLKNRFHKHIGLHHRLSFDPYGAVVDESLLHLSPEFMVKKFFEICSPPKIIEKIKSAFLDFYTKRNLKYSELADFLEVILTSEEKKMLPDWYHHYLQFESNDPLNKGYEVFEGISDLGIVAILKNMNYVNEIKQ